MHTPELDRQPFIALWALPFEMTAGAFQFWPGLFSSAHHLDPDEKEDRVHGQLVVPDSLKTEDDRDLFA